MGWTRLVTALLTIASATSAAAWDSHLVAPSGTHWHQMEVGVGGSGGAVWLLDSTGALWHRAQAKGTFYRLSPPTSHTPAPLAPGGSSGIATLSGALGLSAGFGKFNVSNLVFLQYGPKDLLRLNPNDLFAFPYGTTGEPYLEYTPDSPAFWSAIWAGTPRPGVWGFGDAPSRPGRGFRRGALRRFDAGIDRLGRISGMAVGTGSSPALWLTDKSGLWEAEGPVATPTRRFACTQLPCALALAPTERGLYFATSEQLFLYAGGTLQGRAVQAGMRLIFVDPADEAHLFVATETDVFESVDEGRRLVHRLRVPRGRIHELAYAPGRDRLYVAGSRGLFFQEPGGALQEVPALRGQSVHALAVGGGGRGTLYVAAGVKLYRGGLAQADVEPWQRAPAAIQALRFVAPAGLWALGERQLWRLSVGPGERERPNLRAGSGMPQARALLAREPPLWQLLAAAYRRHVPRVDPTRARWAALLPRVHLMAGAAFGPTRAILNAVYVSQTLGGDPRYVRQTFDNAVSGTDDDAALDRRRQTVLPYVVALASWDLPDWISPGPQRRQIEASFARFDEVERQVRAWSQERRRLLVEWAIRPAPSLVERMELEYRLEELRSLLRGWTGLAPPALWAARPTGRVEGDRVDEGDRE